MTTRNRRLSKLETQQRPTYTGPAIVIFRPGETPQEAAERCGIQIAGRRVVLIPDNGRDGHLSPSDTARQS